MELRDLYLILKQKLPLIALSTLIFSLLGLALFFLLPKKYIASGSFFITHKTETKNAFSYEGYYAQQTALNFSKTLMGLIKSTDIQANALRELSYPVNETTLRNIKKLTNVKLAGPQLVTLNVKGNSEEEATQLWDSLSKSSLNKTKELNGRGDSDLVVTFVNEKASVTANYRNAFLNLIIGALAGLFLSMFGVIFYNYLQEFEYYDLEDLFEDDPEDLESLLEEFEEEEAAEKENILGTVVIKVDVSGTNDLVEVIEEISEDTEVEEDEEIDSLEDEALIEIEEEIVEVILDEDGSAEEELLAEVEALAAANLNESLDLEEEEKS